MYRIERIASRFWRRPHQELLRVQLVGPCSSSGKSLVCLGSLACLLTEGSPSRAAQPQTGLGVHWPCHEEQDRGRTVPSPCPPTTDIVPIPSAWTTCRTTRLCQLRTHMPQAHAMAHPHDRPQSDKQTHHSTSTERETRTRTNNTGTGKQVSHSAGGASSLLRKT